MFKITPAGTLTTLYSFCSEAYCSDGAYPSASQPLARGTDGNFYGTTFMGGTGSAGTLFEVTPEGTLTTLHSFCYSISCRDGAGPDAGLMQATDGNFYGTASQGGLGSGTAFSLSVGLGPFVETVPTAGKVGTKVIILGNNLKGTTSVAFNGTEAKFEVVSDTEITTSVPGGATTGYVTVTTPKRKLQSNVVFRVTK